VRRTQAAAAGRRFFALAGSYRLGSERGSGCGSRRIMLRMSRNISNPRRHRLAVANDDRVNSHSRAACSSDSSLGHAPRCGLAICQLGKFGIGGDVSFRIKRWDPRRWICSRSITIIAGQV